MTQLQKILAFEFKTDDLQSLYLDIQEYDRIRAEEEDANDLLDGENDTNIAFYDPKPLKNAELVRLSKKPMKLEDMLCHSGYKNIGLTVGPIGDKVPTDSEGLCFAFQKKYYEERKADLQRKYGKHELVFKVKEALDVEHLGDGERQVIFCPLSIIKKQMPRRT